MALLIMRNLDNQWRWLGNNGSIHYHRAFNCKINEITHPTPKLTFTLNITLTTFTTIISTKTEIWKINLELTYGKFVNIYGWLDFHWRQNWFYMILLLINNLAYVQPQHSPKISQYYHRSLIFGITWRRPV